MNSTLYIYNFNKTFVRIKTTDLKLYSKIEKFFEHYVEVFDRKIYRKKKVKKSLIENNCYVYVGLLYQFLLYLDESDIPYVMDKSIRLRYSIDEEKLDYFIEKLNPIHNPRPHQRMAFMEVLRRGNGTVLSATSSGKSICMYLLVNYYRMINKKGKKIIIIVPTSGLVEQLYADFIEYASLNDKVNIPHICQRIHSKIKDKDLSKEVLITTWQSEKGTTKKMAKEFGIDLLHNVGCLIFDEVHGAQAKEAKNIISQCVNVDIKAGMTGTLFDVRDEGDVYKNRLIEGLTGQIINAISASEMIELGYACKLQIYNCIIDHGEHDKLSYQEEIKYIETHIGRLNWIVNKFSSLKGNQLILFRTTAYGKALFQLFSKMNVKTVLYVDGLVDRTIVAVKLSP